MTDKEKLIKIKSLADKMYDAAFNLTTDASLLRKAMDKYHLFIIYEYYKKEPVDEKKCMFTKDNYTDEDRKVLCEDCKERCAYAIAGVVSTNAQLKKEPVSDDINEAATLYVNDFIDGDIGFNPKILRNDCKISDAANELETVFKAGAEWADNHQAEKDLELTWEQIYSILYFEREVLHEFGNEEHSNEEVCKEVLKRFKEIKDGKED